MINDSAPEVKLVLCDHEGLGRISVDLEPFFEFSFWMAEELQDLISTHKRFQRQTTGRHLQSIRRDQ
jgi:hypothetical protein